MLQKVIMEEEEIQVSHAKLQKLIRRKVRQSRPMTMDVLEKCNLLKSLLEKRQGQAEQLLRLCRSVLACEEIVKKQYSLLGWEYRDTDSDEDDKAACSGKIPPEINGVNRLLPKLQNNQSLQRTISASFKRRPVVVLTRLPLSDLRLFGAPLEQDNETESLTKSDKSWEPKENQILSDHSVSDNELRPKKRRKTEKTEQQTPQTGSSTNAKSNTVKTSDSTNGDSVSITALTKTSSSEKTPPPDPLRELKVNMTIIAKRNSMTWQLGKISEILMKGERLKYKIMFKEKGKSLVSGHHIAFDCMVKVDQLLVGSRVVVKRKGKQDQFRPGILAELPERKNRMRFLVFFDDHTPLYVGLPLFRLVAKPLADPLDDIKDGDHKDFLRNYLKAWPHSPMNHYRIGQTIHLTLNGVTRRSEVKSIDCSLMQVDLLEDQCPLWIYRGSSCLLNITPLKPSLNQVFVKSKV